MKFVVTKLNNGIKVGDLIPMKQYGGNIGRFFENKLEDLGYPINRGTGVDMPGYYLEVKTRYEPSNSAHTVGAMTLEDILSTEWEDSSVFDKIQIQYRVHYNDYNDEYCIVTRESVYDFRKKSIQSLLKRSYDLGREKLKQHPWDYVRGDDCIGYWELNSSGCYGFRISNAGMTDIENMAKSTFDDMFEVVD